MPPRVLVVSPGETMSDGYLSTAGRLRAARLAERLRAMTAESDLVRVYVAPTPRCVQTVLPFCWRGSTQACVEHALMGADGGEATANASDLRVAAVAPVYKPFEGAGLLVDRDDRRLEDFLDFVRMGFADSTCVVLCPARAGDVTASLGTAVCV